MPLFSDHEASIQLATENRNGVHFILILNKHLQHSVMEALVSFPKEKQEAVFHC